MRRLTTIFYLICIFLSAGYSNEPAEKYLGIADSLFNVEEYNKALVYYEKAGFLTTNNELKTLAIIRKAKCLWELHDYDQSYHSLKRVRYDNLSDSLFFKGKYYTAISAYLTGQYREANSELIQIDAFVQPDSLKFLSKYLHVLVLNELGEWQEAKAQAIKLINYQYAERDSVRGEYLGEVARLYDDKGIPKIKNPDRAEKLAMLLPGTGHIYAGFFWEGVANATLQLVGLGLTGYFIYVKYYVTAGVVGFGLFQKFYAGGLRRAEFLVKRGNYERKRAFNDEVKPYIAKWSNIPVHKKSP